MKKLGLVAGLFCMLVACQNQTNSGAKDGIADANAPYMYFQEETFDAGTVTEGQKVVHTFVMENRGGKDLQIINVETTCGCTVPTYDRKPIPAGKSTKIEVVFNSEGKSGKQNKGITVTSNAVPETKILKLKCVVIESNNKSKKE